MENIKNILVDVSKRNNLKIPINEISNICLQIKEYINNNCNNYINTNNKQYTEDIFLDLSEFNINILLS